MSERDRIWLKNEFAKYVGKDLYQPGIVKEYLEAERILKQLPQTRVIGCKCEYRVFQQTVDRLYKEFIINEEVSDTE